MAQQGNNITKRVNHTPAFLRAAEQDKTGALAYMLHASFGVSLFELVEIAKKMLQDQDENLAHMAIAASIQIRNNVVFVGNDFGGIRQQYPMLIIEGERPQQDIFNFSALHSLGHLFCHLSTSQVARKILSKAGSAITGQGVTESIAGKINRELSDGWAVEDRQEFNAFVTSVTPDQRGLIDHVFDGLKAKADNFRRLLSTQNAPMQGIVVGGGSGGMGGGGGAPMASIIGTGSSAASSLADPDPPLAASVTTTGTTVPSRPTPRRTGAPGST